MGMCDGLEAGVAIAAHILSGDDDVLKRFNDERREEAKITINLTRSLGWFGSLDNGVLRFLRDWLMWFAGRFAFVREMDGVES